MEELVKRMVKDMIVFVISNTLVHNVKLTSVQNVIHMQNVLMDIVNVGQAGMGMATNVSERKDVQNHAVCTQRVNHTCVNVIVVTKETATIVIL